MILAAQSDTLPLTTVDDYADNFLAQQISQVPGVAQVIIGGEQKPAIRVQVDPAKLAASGLTLEDVRSVLVNATTNAAKGTSTDAGQLHHRGQRPDRRRPSRSTTSSSPIATAPRSRSRRRPGGRGPTDRTIAGLPEQQARHPAGRLQAARRQRHRHGRSDQGALPRLTANIPPAIEGRYHPRPHHTIRASVEDVEFTLA
jgi:HAE1 family hydrophobic/amphiphilic exporter-1